MVPPSHTSLTARLFVASCLALALMGCAATPTRANRAATLDLPIGQRLLPNGLRWVAHEDGSQGLLAVVLAVDAGSAFDPRGKAGLAHLVEHLVFRARHEARATVQNRLESIGARYNAVTSADTALYYAIADASQRDRLLAIVRDIARDPVAGLGEADFEIERNVVENERRWRAENGYSSEVFARLKGALYGGSAHANPVLGTARSLGQLSLADVRAFAAEHYRAGAMTLALAGAVGDTSRLEGELSSLSPRATGAARHALRAPGAPADEAPGPVARVEAAVGAPELWLAWPLPGAWGEEGPALDVVERLARVSLGSTTDVRSDVAGVEVFVERGPVVSTLYCRAVLSSLDDVDAARDALAHALDVGTARLALSASSRVHHTRFEATRQLLGLEPLAARALALARAAHHGQDPRLPLAVPAALEALSGADLKAFSDRFLSIERSRSIVLVPSGGGATLALREIEEAGEAETAVDLERALAFARISLEGMKEARLENGMQVVALPRRGARFYAAFLGFLDGAAREPAAVARAADLAMTSYYLSPPAGVAFERMTAADSVIWSARAPASDVGVGLTGILERISNFDIQWKPPGLVQWLKTAARTETALQIIDRRFWQRLAPGSPLVSPLPAEIDALTVTDIRRWRDAVFRPENSLLVLVGPEPAQALAAAREHLGSWRRRGSPPPPVAPASIGRKAPGPRLELVHRSDVSQTTLMLGCALPRDRAGGQAAADVLSEYLGSNIGARLRRAAGSTYTVRYSVESLRGGSSFLAIQSAVANSAVEQAVELFLSPFFAAPDGGWDELLAPARFRALSGVAQSTRTTAELAVHVFDQFRLGRPVRKLADYPAELGSVPSSTVVATLGACRAELVLAAIGRTERIADVATRYARFR